MATIQTRGSIGTKRMISSDPPCKDGLMPLSQLQSVPFKALSRQVLTLLNVHDFKNWLFSIGISLPKWLVHFVLELLEY